MKKYLGLLILVFGICSCQTYAKVEVDLGVESPSLEEGMKEPQNNE